MARLTGIYLLAFATNLHFGSIAVALQQPLLGDSPQTTLTPPSSKSLVNSEALQAAISGDRLLAKAKDLFEIAELSHDDYNRPTRVIGSKGKLTLDIEAPSPLKGHISPH